MARGIFGSVLALLATTFVGLALFWWSGAKDVLFGAFLRWAGLSPDSLSVDAILKLIVMGLPLAGAFVVLRPFIKAYFAKDRQPKLKKELHPRRAYETLTSRWKYWRWVWADRQDRRASNAEEITLRASILRERAAARAVTPEQALSDVSAETLANYGYRSRASDPEHEKLSRRSWNASTRRREAEDALDADFHARLERGDLIAHGMRANTYTGEIIERSFWRGAKIDKALLFENRMQDLAGVRWISIAIGKKV